MNSCISGSQQSQAKRSHGDSASVLAGGAAGPVRGGTLREKSNRPQTSPLCGKQGQVNVMNDYLFSRGFAFTRREFLQRWGLGFGGLALAYLLNEGELYGAAPVLSANET